MACPFLWSCWCQKYINKYGQYQPATIVMRCRWTFQQDESMLFFINSGLHKHLYCNTLLTQGHFYQWPSYYNFFCLTDWCNIFLLSLTFSHFFTVNLLYSAVVTLKFLWGFKEEIIIFTLKKLYTENITGTNYDSNSFSTVQIQLNYKYSLIQVVAVSLFSVTVLASRHVLKWTSNLIT